MKKKEVKIPGQQTAGWLAIQLVGSLPKCSYNIPQLPYQPAIAITWLVERRNKSFLTPKIPSLFPPQAITVLPQQH